MAKSTRSQAKKPTKMSGKTPVAGGVLAGVGLGAAALLKRRRSAQNEAVQPAVVVEPAIVEPAVVPPAVTETDRLPEDVQ